MRILARLMAIILALLCPICRFSETDHLPAMQAAELSVGTEDAGSSIYSWDMYLFNENAFPALSRVLTAYNIDRVYQAIPNVYFDSFEVASLVKNCADMGIEVVALNGSPSWQNEGLSVYYQWIDALCAYNEAHPSEAIHAVALDVESHTLEQFKSNMKKGFADYVDLMWDACQYAHARGLSVVQVIPTMFDKIDPARFEWFIRNCCDELSVMNYEKEGAVENIRDEVSLCKQNGIRIESIFETMPISSQYRVTEKNTYYNVGEDALRAAAAELKSVYGPSLGLSYHYFSTMFYLYTGSYLAEFYIYADPDNPLTDENSQIYVGESVQLEGENGDLLTAWVYNPNRNIDRQEYCYLAVGVYPDMNYQMKFEDDKFKVYSPKTINFSAEYGQTAFTRAIGVRS